MDHDATEGEGTGLEAALLHYEIEADVLALPGAVTVVETDLSSDAEAALEEGIASVFDELRTSDAEYVAAAIDDGDPEAVEPTVALLAELNRLWALPPAA